MNVTFIRGLFFIALLLAFTAEAQIPQVPERIYFGDMVLDIDAKARAEIQADVDRLHRNPTYFQALLHRVNLYFPVIEEVLREERIPEEFKYLVIQESALVSDAVSVSNAVGFWQFKMASAQEVGLRVDRNVDERMNIESATRGAARYLKRNNARFDNWVYALLAYNVGPGGAMSITDKSYYGAKRMPITTQTHWYVKKFFAHQVAFQGKTGLDYHPDLRIFRLRTKGGEDLQQISREYGIDQTELERYNKWLQSNRVPDDRAYTLILPVAHSNSTALAKLTNTPPPTAVASTKDVVPAPTEVAKMASTRFVLKNSLEGIAARSGDTQKALAKEAGISRAKLRRYNDLVKNEPVRSGQIYYLEKKKNKADQPFHVLQPGQDLWAVSQEHGIKLDRLIKLNRLEPTEAVKAGRKLHLQKRIKKNQQPEYLRVSQPERNTATPAQPPAVSTQPPSRESRYAEPERKISAEPIIPPGHQLVEHRVSRGENYFSIAQKHGVSVDNILIWNDANAAEPLKEGRILKVYVNPNRKVLPPAGKDAYYEVQPGDTLFGISRKTGASIETIRDLNELKNDTIHPGQKLRIKL